MKRRCSILIHDIILHIVHFPFNLFISVTCQWYTFPVNSFTCNSFKSSKNHSFVSLNEPVKTKAISYECINQSVLKPKLSGTASIRNCIIKILISHQSTHRGLWFVNQLILAKSEFQYNIRLTQFRVPRKLGLCTF